MTFSITEQTENMDKMSTDFTEKGDNTDNVLSAIAEKGDNVSTVITYTVLHSVTTFSLDFHNGQYRI
jgi:hypothetical protein